MSRAAARWLSLGWRGRVRLKVGLFDTLQCPADQIRGGLGDGQVIQQVQDFFGGIQSILELSIRGSGKNHLDQRAASSIGAFEKQINRMPIIGAETLIHEIPVHQS